MNDLLNKQPENVVVFLQEWIKTTGSKYEVGELDVKAQLPTSDEDIEEEMNSDDEAQLESKRNSEARKTTKKLAVSAEAYGEYNKLSDYTPKVVTKTPEQSKQIQEILMKSFMFRTLDPKALKIVIGAMEIRKFQNNQQVIK